MILAVAAIGCGGGGAQQVAKQPLGHVEVKNLESPDDAPEEAKTIQVSYVFDRDLLNKEFKKSFAGGFDKKGVKVEEQLDARAHFEVSGAKITGTVTYVKKGRSYSILDADLVAEAHYDADVQIDFDVKVKGDTKKANDGDWNNSALHGKPYPLVKNLMPANIPIAGPLFLHAHFDLNAACEIGVEGQMHATAGVGIKGDARLAARYKKTGFEDAAHPDAKKKKLTFEAKAPNFELSPKPYLQVEGRQQSIKGWCSLQPTAVLLVDGVLGASMVVEPWIEMEAKRSSTRQPWNLGAEAGFTVSAAPELRIFGRKIGKRHEFELMEVTLAKMSGGDLASGPSSSPKALPAAEPKRPGKAAPTEVAALPPVENVLSSGLGSDPADRAAPAAAAAPAPSDGSISTVAVAFKTNDVPAAPPAESAAVTPPSSAPPSAVADATPAPATESDDAPPKPSKPAKASKGVRALRALAGGASAKPVARTPTGLAGIAKALKKKKI